MEFESQTEKDHSPITKTLQVQSIFTPPYSDHHDHHGHSFCLNTSEFSAVISYYCRYFKFTAILKCIKFRCVGTSIPP